MFTAPKFTEIYYIADNFCKVFASRQEKYTVKEKDCRRRNKSNRMSDAGGIVILILYFIGIYIHRTTFILPACCIAQGVYIASRSE